MKIGNIFRVGLLAEMAFLPMFLEGANPTLWPSTKKDQMIHEVSVADTVRWIPFSSHEDGFSVKFPGFPLCSSSASMKNGKIEMCYSDYICSKVLTTVPQTYRVSVREYCSAEARKKLPSDLRLCLEGFRGLLFEGGKGRGELVDTQLIQEQGFPAIAFSEKSGTSYVRGKVILVQNKLYYVGAHVLSLEAADENYDCFIGSFKLNK